MELGFRQGGPAGYGLRRQLIDRDRNPKSLLAGVSERACRPIESSWFLGQFQKLRLFGKFTTCSLFGEKRNARSWRC